MADRAPAHLSPAELGVERWCEPGVDSGLCMGSGLCGRLTLLSAHTRSLKLGNLAFSRADLASMERSVGRLRTMHSKMLMDIEKVQFHYGGSVKASSQMIHELLQAQCLGSPCCKR